jgi:hypothetical protein
MTNLEMIEAINISLESDRLRLIPLAANHGQLLFPALQNPMI